MATVRLHPQNDADISISDGLHPSITICQWRLRAWVRVGEEFSIRQAILDSGAPLAVMSKEVWKSFDERGKIEWVAHPPGIQDDLSRMGHVIIHGGRYPYRLGRIAIQLAELSGPNVLPTVPVLIQFLEDLPAPLLLLAACCACLSSASVADYSVAARFASALILMAILQLRL